MTLLVIVLLILAVGGTGELFAESASSSSPDPGPAGDVSIDDSLDTFSFGGSSVKLTAPQIAALAASAGFSGEDVATATAIALAESGGNPNAYNPETAAGTPQGQGSYGLWQIYLKAHPEFQGVDLTDPQLNAFAAFQVFSASGFRAWSTFKNNAYSAHLADAQQAADQVA